MTEKKPPEPSLIEMAVAVLEHLCLTNSTLEPWRDAVRHLLSGNVEAASEIAFKAFNNGAPLDHRINAIELISRVAVEGGAHGHWYESLLLMAAEAGFSDAAYNVGNLIEKRANTEADHALAHRYFTQAARNATDPRTKASALVNSCGPIRDGRFTGKPDWVRAVEIYEQAAELNLAVGMFNAGNVSYWLKEKGEFGYAARAVKWFTRLIDRVDANLPFVDIGGAEDIQPSYDSAKSLLATLHAMDQVETPDVDFILSVATTEPNSERAAWLRNRAYDLKLRNTAIQAKPAAWENWLAVMSLMGWKLHGKPQPLNLGTGTGDSRLLKFSCEQGDPLAFAVVDLDEIANNGGLNRLHELVNEIKSTHSGQCVAIGAKGLFFQVTQDAGYSSYTVCVSSDEGGVPVAIPIWPGVTTDDVVDLILKARPRYRTDNTDAGNTVAILINALGSGMSLNGENFPEAIYVNVGDVFNTPVLNVQQALALSTGLSAEEIIREFEGLKAHFAEGAQRKRLYLGHPIIDATGLRQGKKKG